MLLPKIAKIFNITIDELFGIKVNKEIVYMMNGDALWNDDWKIRVAVYCGRKLINHSELECFEGTNLMTINVPWSEGEVINAPWGASNATINYNYVEV
jgi:hypothetical protein